MVLSKLFSFLKGHLVIPCARQTFLSEVKHMPICAATCFSGRWKYELSFSNVNVVDILLALCRTIRMFCSDQMQVER